MALGKVGLPALVRFGNGLLEDAVKFSGLAHSSFGNGSGGNGYNNGLCGHRRRCGGRCRRGRGGRSRGHCLRSFCLWRFHFRSFHLWRCHLRLRGHRLRRRTTQVGIRATVVAAVDLDDELLFLASRFGLDIMLGAKRGPVHGEALRGQLSQAVPERGHAVGALTVERDG